MTDQEREKIEKALLKQVELLQRASEQVANSENLDSDEIRDLCRLSEAMALTVRSFPGESSSILP